MQGSLTIPHPLAQLGRATEVEKAAQYFNCAAVHTAAMATEDAALASFGDGQIRIFRSRW